jgi:hypothetical protein
VVRLFLAVLCLQGLVVEALLKPLLIGLVVVNLL